MVERTLKTPTGQIPIIKTMLERADVVGGIGVRLGIKRDRYLVPTGLYGVGNPGADSPVLVTANYKLSLDALRKELGGIDAWILVLNTLGVNVWCAAGKGTFATDELIYHVKDSGLDKIVSHRKLILPQFGATGVAARPVKKASGFRVVWGPIQARDIKAFLKAGMKTDKLMRSVTFSLRERTVLIPVEVSFMLKPAALMLLAALVLSGIGPEVFSPQAAWQRGSVLLAALLTGIVAGAVAVPFLLPWIPGRAFSFKGALTGALGGIGVVYLFRSPVFDLENIAILLASMALSSFLAMNFTGSTPFTSPSGVEKEMRYGIPLQAIAAVTVVVLWITAGFIS